VDRIREFHSSDIEQVADLHRKLFKLEITQPQKHHDYFAQEFLSRGSQVVPSLVCEDAGGRVIGFLGVAVRHFCFGKKRITAALSSQFIVHPEGRGRLTGVHLLREFLRGPQDLSFTDEANEISKRIWVALGGSTSTLQGIHWVIPLRPVQLACSHYAPTWLTRTLRSPANILDRVIASLPGSPFRDRRPALASEPLSNEVMLKCLEELTSHYDIRPFYDSTSLGTLIQRAGEKTQGLLRARLLTDEANRIAGWYMFCCKPGGLAEVLQVVAREDCRQEVVAQLAGDAKNHGAIAVVGRLEPGLAEGLANQFSLFFRRKHLMLVHSRFPEILSAIHSGQAFITRLEGEWCLRFS
jgi:hypothetical protein